MCVMGACVVGSGVDIKLYDVFLFRKSPHLEFEMRIAEHMVMWNVNTVMNPSA